MFLPVKSEHIFDVCLVDHQLSHFILRLAVFGVQGWNCDFQILSTTAYYGLKIWQVVFVGIVINYVVVLSVMAFTLLLSAACKTPLI